MPVRLGLDTEISTPVEMPGGQKKNRRRHGFRSPLFVPFAGSPQRLPLHSLSRRLFFAGGFGGGALPVPIPNTEVKPARAHGTAGATPWESRSPPAQNAPRGPGGAQNAPPGPRP